ESAKARWAAVKTDHDDLTRSTRPGRKVSSNPLRMAHAHQRRCVRRAHSAVLTWPVPHESSGQIGVPLGCNTTSRPLLSPPRLAIGAVNFPPVPLDHRL